VFVRIINGIRRRLNWFYERRYYFRHKVVGTNVPPHSLSYLPDVFCIHRIGQTGVSVVDGFCTQTEAQAVIDFARDKMRPAAVRVNGEFVLSEGRQSETARLFGPGNPDARFLDLACRAAMLAGLPYNYLEGVYVTRYAEGGFYNEHVDYGFEFKTDRLYTVLLYLNDMAVEEGGSTAFPSLNIEVQPRAGRAVSWTNKNPDNSVHMETSHAALPVKAGAEKWTIQFWFHPHKMFDELDIAPPQSIGGIPLQETDALLDGTRFVTKD